MSDIWKQQKDETPKSWRAFCIYREMAPENRSYAKVAEALGRPRGYTRYIEEWGSKYDWQARVLAFDNHQASLRLDESNKKRQSHREKMLERYDKVLDMLDEALDNFRITQADIIQDTEDPQRPGHRLRVIKVRNTIHDGRMLINSIIEADKAKRLALGMATSITSQHIDHTSDGEQINNTIEFRWVDSSDNSGFEQEQ